ncbi:putative transcriptional regulator [Streptomyces bingchenggensis BCW-1]|uniref:Putative transcriptional regulator n=1 Tax=Streptomyces bingchenggensis (strain BCW-1) TaxID=749414 RepID=D7C9W5_STRBB|nr:MULTISPECIES: AraC family transcriptional regulator [Streptomyces]ADI04293.1 putative transcriptional regulator [Streptomyces bingchenggensis BCW-1]
MSASEAAATTHDGSIPGFGFNPPTAPVAGFELTELASLHERMADGSLQRVHRVDFHTVTLITEGSGEHAVDFVTYHCRPGTLLWIRPGQVQRFGRPGTMTGTHLLFTPTFPPHLAGTDRVVREWYGPVCRQLGTGHEYAALSALLSRVRAEFTRPDGTVSQEILQLLLATVLLHIDRLPQPGTNGDPHAGGEVYARFRAQLECSYATTRRAEDYAHRLGYTVKTLTRACLAATGQPVKQVIDARVALEAQRLLAHTDEPVAIIARRLGFSEPTNFGKFFTRHTGTTPGAFRRTHHAAQ